MMSAETITALPGRHPPLMAYQKVRVRFSSDYTSQDGRRYYEAGKSYDVDAPDARLYEELGKALPDGPGPIDIPGNPPWEEFFENTVIPAVKAGAVKGDRGDDGKDGANVATTRAAVASELNDPESPSRAVLSATIAQASGSGMQDVYAKAKAGVQPVHKLIVTDSTGTIGEGPQAWTYHLPALYVAEFPGRQIEYVAWDYVAPGSQAGVAWLPPVVVQAGAGPTITLWLAGAAANNWRYFFNDIRRDTIFTAARFDAIIFGLGHNDGFVGSPPWKQVEARNVALIEWARTYQPQAQIVLSSQNPRTAAAADPTPLRNETRNDLYRETARKRSFGYINITQAFLDDGRAIPLVLVDSGGVHTTAAGAQLWAATFMRTLRATAYAIQLPDQPPAFTRKGSPLVNLRSIPALTVNLTETEDGTVRRRSPKSRRMVKTANGSQSFDRWVLPIDQVRGRTITALAWVHIPATAYSGTGSIWILVNGAVVGDSIIESSTRDQWMPIAVTASIPRTANEVRVHLVVEPSGGSTNTAEMWLDEGNVWLGDAPFDTEPAPTAPDGSAGKASSLRAIAQLNGIAPASFITNHQVNASAEQEAPGFTTFDSGGTSASRSAEWSATGNFSWKAVCNAVLQHDNLCTDAAYRPTATPGEVWTASAMIRNAMATNRDFRVGLAYYNAAGARIGAVEFPGAAATTIAGGTSQRVTATGAGAPAGTTHVAAVASRRAAAPAVGGDVFFVDDIIHVKATSAPVAPANADTDSLYFYEGTPGISASKGLPS